VISETIGWEFRCWLTPVAVANATVIAAIVWMREII